MIETTLLQQVVSSLQDGMDIVFAFSIMYLYWTIKSKLSMQDVQIIFKELFQHQEEVFNLKFEMLHQKLAELKEDIRDSDHHSSI